MEISKILAQIDQEIAQLRKARTLLAGGTGQEVKKKVGRPKNAADRVAPAAKKSVKKKRNLTPEGRARIAEAVRRRWAAQKRAASTK